MKPCFKHVNVMRKDSAMLDARGDASVSELRGEQSANRLRG